MISNDLLYSKLRAFGIHFSLSLVIFFFLLYFVIFKWYPFPFFYTDGGWQGIRIIAGVDLILGPTLTFIVFNPRKPLKLLKLDLGLIALAQVVALTWGIYTVHNERPYLAVFADGIIYPLAYYQLSATGLNKEDINKLNPKPTPKIIYVDIPEDEHEYLALLTKAVTSKPVHYMGDRYQAFDTDQIKNILRFSIDMEAYLKGEPEAWQKEYRAFIKAYPDSLDATLFLPLNARYGKYILALDRNSLDFIEVLDIPPPKIDEVIWGKEKSKQRRQRPKVKAPVQPVPAPASD